MMLTVPKSSYSWESPEIEDRVIEDTVLVRFSPCFLMNTDLLSAFHKGASYSKGRQKGSF